MRNTQPRVDAQDERNERMELVEIALGLRDELPDQDDRAALARAILDGEVEYLYRPCAADYHNVTIPGLPAWVDPRIKVADWAAIHRAGHDVAAVMLAEAEARATAASEYTRGARAREDAEFQAHIADDEVAWEDWWQGDARDDETLAVAKRAAAEARARADEMIGRQDS